MVITLGGGLSTPTSSEMFEGAEDTLVRPLSFTPEDTGPCLNTSLVANLSSPVSEGFPGRAVQVAPSFLLPARSGPDSSTRNLLCTPPLPRKPLRFQVCRCRRSLVLFRHFLGRLWVLVRSWSKCGCGS
jgi:hypothetical protein